MEKLTIKELAPYLPYGLGVHSNHNEYIMSLDDDTDSKSIWIVDVIDYNMKPILRPLSDYITFYSITDEMSDYQIQMIEENPDMVKRLHYDVMEKMFENHIDVFGLIEKGLAIDKNKLEK